VIISSRKMKLLRGETKKENPSKREGGKEVED